MKTILIIVLIISLNTSIFGQVKPEDKYFNEFDKTSSIAFALFSIDKALYSSLDMLKLENSDSLAKVSMYRFCIPDSSSKYNVIYGYPDADNFIQLFNYQCDSSFNFVKLNRNFDIEKVNLLYKLASQKQEILAKYAKQRVDMTYYFLFNSDTINLVILPSWQKSQFAVYGPDYQFSFDQKGNQIDSNISEIEPLAFSIENDSNDDIYLDLRNSETASLSAIFFTMIYQEFFKEIYIDTKRMKCYLINMSDFRWGHIYKEKKN